MLLSQTFSLLHTSDSLLLMNWYRRLVNIIAGRLPDKLDEVPYRSSRLTHLLRESFGGNAKLSVICTIRPDHK